MIRAGADFPRAHAPALMGFVALYFLKGILIKRKNSLLSQRENLRAHALALDKNGIFSKKMIFATPNP